MVLDRAKIGGGGVNMYKVSKELDCYMEGIFALTGVPDRFFGLFMFSDGVQLSSSMDVKNNSFAPLLNKID